MLGLKNPALDFLVFSVGRIVVRRMLGDRLFKTLLLTEFLLKAVIYTC